MMATYNGQDFLMDQIQSILKQKNVDVTLRICDDCSTDGTFKLEQDLAAKYPNIIPTQNQKNLGVSDNFLQMLFEAEADGYDYYAFSDQDDVWLPRKLSAAVTQLQAAPSNNHGRLYFSDLMNVDVNLKPIGRVLTSFNFDKLTLGTPLMMSWSHGCTMVFDSTLLTLLRAHRAESFPRHHDAWVHLVSQYLNATIIQDRQNAYILRRITGHNTVGQVHFGFQNSKDIAAIFRHASERPSHYYSRAAEMLLETCGKDMTKQNHDIVTLFATHRNSLGGRLRIFFSPQFKSPSWKQGLVNRVKFLVGRF